MDIERTLPTRGQLQRQLSQTIQSLYRLQFGHLPRKVVCHIFADKVAIIAEDTVTGIEQILLENSKPDLAYSVRKAINTAFTAYVKQQVADILQIEVIDVLSDSTLDSGHLGIIVFLKNQPEVRLSKKEHGKNKNLL